MAEQAMDRMDRMGSMERDGEQVVLRYERRLGHRPETVWRALTESEGLQHWFPADIVGKRAAGAEVTLRFWPRSVAAAGDELAEIGVDPGDPSLPGRILTWDPPRVFELTWDADRLRFELEPDGDATLLRFTTWIPLGGEGPHGAHGALAGYHVCLDALAETVDTGAARQPGRDEIAALEERYAALVAR
ncbi:SRPBCC domain-containing protein [Nocardioides sp. SYSU DS0651]|uniref:SRPBCC domain-containing protein n=1 Tax=Nocardioides sp. SYSU DS0651 TaxID=3415955 RepID=UPI003F4BF596